VNGLLATEERDLFSGGSLALEVGSLRRFAGLEAAVTIVSIQEQPCSFKCSRKLTAHFAFEDMS